MEAGFLFWLYLAGIFVAILQDLKRREVDNWLNLFLIFTGTAYVFFGAVLSKESAVFFHVGFLLVVMFLLVNLFYYGRVFAGGDAKLLFALTPGFLGLSFLGSMVNVGIFLFLLMVSGSVYGICYSGFLWVRNWDRVNREMVCVARRVGVKNLVIGVLVGVGLLWFGLLRGGIFFGLLGGCLVVFPFLGIFAKGLENVSMIRKVSGRDLREGDWLVEDVRVGRRTVKADWEGLSLDDLKILKNKKAVLIKEGMPFVPAFLVAFLGYVFLRGWVLGMLG